MPKISVSLNELHIEAVKRYQAQVGLTGERDFSKALQLIIVNFDKSKSSPTVTPHPDLPDIQYDQRDEIEILRDMQNRKVAA